MDVTIIPDDDAHAAVVARMLLRAAGAERAHLVRIRSDVAGGLGFVVPADLAHTVDGEDSDEPDPTKPTNPHLADPNTPTDTGTRSDAAVSATPDRSPRQPATGRNRRR